MIRNRDTSRYENWFFSRRRLKEGEELEWVRPEGLPKVELPRPVVLINGAFDLLHSGHMRIIFAAREKAGEEGTLVCALDSDGRVGLAKGKGRPVLSFVERASALAYMPIDYLVEISTDGELSRVMGAICPDLRVQGSDYKDHKSKYPNIPKMFVGSGLGAMRTSEIVRRIKEKICGQ